MDTKKFNASQIQIFKMILDGKESQQFVVGVYFPFLLYLLPLLVGLENLWLKDIPLISWNTRGPSFRRRKMVPSSLSIEWSI